MSKMCCLTSTQLATLLNWLLGTESFDRLIVESWDVRERRLSVERWTHAVLEDCGAVPFAHRTVGRRTSLIPPSTIERFVSEDELHSLLIREKWRARKVDAA